MQVSNVAPVHNTQPSGQGSHLYVTPLAYLPGEHELTPIKIIF